MGPNTKYQSAPQRDSFDEPAPSYTQAPPSYQAEASQRDPMLGGARDEDDNLPDDFKVHILSTFDRAMQADFSLVRWLRRRGHFTHPDAVRSQGVRHSVCATIFPAVQEI